MSDSMSFVLSAVVLVVSRLAQGFPLSEAIVACVSSLCYNIPNVDTSYLMSASISTGVQYSCKTFCAPAHIYRFITKNRLTKKCPVEVWRSFGTARDEILLRGFFAVNGECPSRSAVVKSNIKK